MGTTVGIDLGTTNSVVCVKKVATNVVPNAEGDELTPSCVTAIPKDGNDKEEIVVGKAARNLLKQYPEQTIISVKRLMGRDFDEPEVQTMINDNRIAYPIINEPSEPGSLYLPFAGKQQTPEMISGLILRKIISDSETALNENIDQAVVTVPAYFSDNQKFATRAACDYAGIKLLRLLPEPTAAALSFELDLNEDEAQTIMVFDLGGGTFDISILSYASGSFMEVTKGGDMWLGGDDVDQLIVDYVITTAEKDNNIASITTLIDTLPAADKARFIVELKEKAEIAKIQLSTQDEASIELFGVLKDEDQQLVDIDVSLSRETLNGLLKPILDRITTISEQILHEISFDKDLIDTVLLVGGSASIPAIQETLKTVFGEEKVNVHPRPMLAIAEGAARMATKMISQDNSDESFSLMHSAAHDYYLQLAEGKRHLLVARNTPLPATVNEKFSFAKHDQILARLRVFNEIDGIMETVGELWFHNDEKRSEQYKDKKPPEINLEFSVDENNIIHMKASSVKNTALSTEARIARGGSAAKLYSDLETGLSTIIATGKSGTVEEDILRLSHKVVSTISQVSDPNTGETSTEKKNKAQKQINTLKTLSKKEIVTLSGYQMAVKAQTFAADILNQTEQKRLDDVVEKFNHAIENLDNADHIEECESTLDDIYEDYPLLLELTRSQILADELEDENRSHAKTIRKKIKKIVNYHVGNEPDKVEETEHELKHFVHSNYSFSDEPTRRFDRDVTI